MSDAADRPLRVTVVHALPERQWLLAVALPAGCVVEDAIVASGITRSVPGLEVDARRVGVFGKPCDLRTPLRDGDRVELYRPLAIDPKEVRRKRAEAATSDQRPRRRS